MNSTQSTSSKHITGIQLFQTRVYTDGLMPHWIKINFVNAVVNQDLNAALRLAEAVAWWYDMQLHLLIHYKDGRRRLVNIFGDCYQGGQIEITGENADGFSKRKLAIMRVGPADRDRVKAVVKRFVHTHDVCNVVIPSGVCEFTELQFLEDYRG